MFSYDHDLKMQLLLLFFQLQQALTIQITQHKHKPEVLPSALISQADVRWSYQIISADTPPYDYCQTKYATADKFVFVCVLSNLKSMN